MECIPMSINEKSFSVFYSAHPENQYPETWKGKNPIKWFQNVTEASCKRDALNAAGPEAMDRGRLFEFCANPTVEAMDIFVAVCAWGGMRVDHGRRAWPLANIWGPAIDELKANCLSNREAYGLFDHIRGEGGLSGVGPAYFTKFIFFVRPDLGGYIMDQWTERSINLLYGTTIKLIRGKDGQYVGKNSPEIYEDFCRKIEDVSGRLNITPEKAEIALFSNGGKRPGAWRKYVKCHA